MDPGVGIGDAQIVIAEGFDNAAVGDRTALTQFEHPLQFAFQSLQVPDALLHLGELRARDLIHRLAGFGRIVGEVEKDADVVELEPEITGVTDEPEAPRPALIVKPLISR